MDGRLWTSIGGQMFVDKCLWTDIDGRTYVDRHRWMEGAKRTEPNRRMLTVMDGDGWQMAMQRPRR